jgi:hypothetical protein
MATQITAADLNSLAAELDGLDLTDDEQAILNSIFERAEAAGHPEVAGYFVACDRALRGGWTYEQLTPTAQNLYAGIVSDNDTDLI